MDAKVPSKFAKVHYIGPWESPKAKRLVSPASARHYMTADPPFAEKPEVQ